MLPRGLQAFPILKLMTYGVIVVLLANDSVSHYVWLVLKFSELPDFLPECGYEVANVV